MENGKSIVTLHPFALTAMVHLARPITQEKAHGTGDEGGRTPQARLMTQTAPSPSRTVYHDEASATAPAPRTEHDAPCPQPGAALRQVPSAGPSPHGADDGAQAMSHAITRLRFPLILLVVLMHSTGYPALSRHHVDLTRLDAGGVYDLVRLALAYVLGAGAVPCFFLISGYLFYYSTGGRLTRPLYTRKVRRRIHSLLLPYLLWNVLALLLLALTRQPHYSLAELSDTLLTHPAQTLYGWLWSGPKGYPVNVPLWYMRDLLVLTLAAPALPWLSASRYPVTHWRSWLLPAALVAAYLLRLLLLFALFLPLFRLRLLGGGDVKLLAVSGAYLGCGRFLWFFFFTLAAAAVPSAYLFLKGFRRTRIPLGPCFLVGYGLLSVLQPA